MFYSKNLILIVSFVGAESFQVKENVFLLSDCLLFATRSFSLRKIVYFSDPDSIFKLSPVQSTEDLFRSVLRFHFELVEVHRNKKEIFKFMSQKENKIREWASLIGQVLEENHKKAQSRGNKVCPVFFNSQVLYFKKQDIILILNAMILANSILCCFDFSFVAE